MGFDVETGAHSSKMPMELDMAAAKPVLDTLAASTSQPENLVSAKPIDSNIMLQDPTISTSPNSKVRNHYNWLITVPFS